VVAVVVEPFTMELVGLVAAAALAHLASW